MEKVISGTNIRIPFEIGELIDANHGSIWATTRVFAIQANDVFYELQGQSTSSKWWDQTKILKKYVNGNKILVHQIVVVDGEQASVESIDLNLEYPYKVKFENGLFKHVKDYQIDQSLKIPHGLILKCNYEYRNYLYQLSLFNRMNEMKGKLKNQLSLSQPIYEVEPDGNCMFRAVSHQLYQTQENHDLIRQTSMLYLEKHQEFFSSFIINHQIKDYINWKKQSGVWGDNLELQLIYEIYQIPIKVYTPQNIINIPPDSKSEDTINLSYNGFSHYDSIPLNKQPLLNGQPGYYEQQALSRNIQFDKIYEESRKQFLIESQKNEQKILEQSQNDYLEKQYMNMAIEQKVEEQSAKEYEQQILKQYEQEHRDTIFQNICEQIQLMGDFPIERIYEGLTMYGDDIEQILNYLYDQ